MRAAAIGLALIVLVAAPACLGGASHGGGAPPSQEAAAGPHVDWTIRYAIGFPFAQRAKLTNRCPAGARCADTQVMTATYGSGRHPWVVMVTRHVSCHVDASVPSPDCRAIVALRRALRAKHRMFCACSAMIEPPGSATATIHGHRVVVPLDYCTYCGGPRAAIAALRTLQRTR